MSGRNEVKIDAWVALIRAQRIALAAVQRALKEAGLPPLLEKIVEHVPAPQLDPESRAAVELVIDLILDVLPDAQHE